MHNLSQRMIKTRSVLHTQLVQSTLRGTFIPLSNSMTILSRVCCYESSHTRRYSQSSDSTESISQRMETYHTEIHSPQDLSAVIQTLTTSNLRRTNMKAKRSTPETGQGTHTSISGSNTNTNTNNRQLRHVNPENHVEILFRLFQQYKNTDKLNEIVVSDLLRELGKLIPTLNRRKTHMNTQFVSSEISHQLKEIFEWSCDFFTKYRKGIPSMKSNESRQHLVRARTLGSIAFSSTRLRPFVSKRTIEELFDAIGGVLQYQININAHRQWHPADISSLTYSFGQIRWNNPTVLQGLGDAATLKITHLNDKGLSNILHAFTMLGHLHEPLLYATAEVYIHRLSQCSPQALTTIVNAMRLFRSTASNVVDSTSRTGTRTRGETRTAAARTETAARKSAPTSTIPTLLSNSINVSTNHDQHTTSNVAADPSISLHSTNISSMKPFVADYDTMGIEHQSIISRFLFKAIEESSNRLHAFKPMELINFIWGIARASQAVPSFGTHLASSLRDTTQGKKSVNTTAFKYTTQIQDSANADDSKSLTYINEDAHSRSVHSALSSLLSFINQRITIFNLQDLCLLAHGIACLEMRPNGTSNVMVTVANAILPLIHQLNAQQISMLVYSFGKLRITHHAFLASMTAHASTVCEQFTTQGIANVAWGLGQLGYRNESLMHLLANMANQNMKRMKPVEMAMMADAFSRLHIRADFLMHAFALEASIRINSFTPKDLGILAYSLVLAGTTRRVPLLFDATVLHLEHCIPNIRTVDAINLLWAFTVAMYFDEDAIRMLLGVIQRTAPQFHRHDIDHPFGDFSPTILIRLQSALLVIEHLTPFPELLEPLDARILQAARLAFRHVGQTQSELLQDEHAQLAHKSSFENVNKNTSSASEWELSKLSMQKLTSSVKLVSSLTPFSAFEPMPNDETLTLQLRSANSKENEMTATSTHPDLIALYAAQQLRSDRLHHEIGAALSIILNHNQIQQPNNEDLHDAMYSYLNEDVGNIRSKSRNHPSNQRSNQLSNQQPSNHSTNNSDIPLLADDISFLSSDHLIEQFETPLGLIVDYALPKEKIAFIAEGIENFRPISQSSRHRTLSFFTQLTHDPNRFESSEPVLNNETTSEWKTIGDGHFQVPESGIVFPGLEDLSSIHPDKEKMNGNSSKDNDIRSNPRKENKQNMSQSSMEKLSPKPYDAHTRACDMLGKGYNAARSLDFHIRLLPALVTHHLLLEAAGWTVIRIPFHRWIAAETYDRSICQSFLDTVHASSIENNSTMSNILYSKNESHYDIKRQQRRWAEEYASQYNPKTDYGMSPTPSQLVYLQRQLRAAIGAFNAQIVPPSV